MPSKFETWYFAFLELNSGTLFRALVDELDLILGRLGEEKYLEETIMELVGTSRSDKELKV